MHKSGLVSRVLRIQNMLLNLIVCDYKPQHLALRVDANLMADVCKNHRALFL